MEKTNRQLPEVSHPQTFQDSSTPLDTSPLNLLAVFKAFSVKQSQNEIMQLTYCQILSLIERTVLFSKEEEIKFK